jgi:hypothetical protein
MLFGQNLGVGGGGKHTIFGFVAFLLTSLQVFRKFAPYSLTPVVGTYVLISM